MIEIKEIHRFPVKGLSAERLDATTLLPRQSLPGDRAYAFARASAPFDASAPKHLPKANFVMLMRDEELARLNTHYDPASRKLTIKQGGVTVMDGKLGEPADCRRLENFFQEFLDLVERHTFFHQPEYL